MEEQVLLLGQRAVATARGGSSVGANGRGSWTSGRRCSLRTEGREVGRVGGGSERRCKGGAGLVGVGSGRCTAERAHFSLEQLHLLRTFRLVSLPCLLHPLDLRLELLNLTRQRRIEVPRGLEPLHRVIPLPLRLLERGDETFVLLPELLDRRQTDVRAHQLAAF